MILPEKDKTYQHVDLKDCRATVLHLDSAGDVAYVTYLRHNLSIKTIHSGTVSAFWDNYKEPDTFFSVDKKYRWKNAIGGSTYEIVELYRNDNPTSENHALEALSLAIRPDGRQSHYVLDKADFRDMVEVK